MAANLIDGQARCGIGAVQRVAHILVDFGRQHHTLPAAAALCKPLADDRFRNAGLTGQEAVIVGRIKEIDAGIQCSIHDVKCIFFGGRAAKVHGAQAQAADPQAGTAQFCVFHKNSPRSVLSGRAPH